MYIYIYLYIWNVTKIKQIQYIFSVINSNIIEYITQKKKSL